MNQEQSTTEKIALQLAQRAVSSINGQLKIELERYGFKAEDVAKGKVKLTRIVEVSKEDARFIAEAYSIEFPVKNGKPVERLIMCVKWTPSGFSIERNSDSVANAIKVNPSFMIKKTSKLDLSVMTSREIEIEHRANEYMAKMDAKDIIKN